MFTFDGEHTPAAVPRGRTIDGATLGFHLRHTPLKAYRSREKIEELFATYKESFDGRKRRTWYSENLYGRQFAQFVGPGYHCFLMKKIQDVKTLLAQKKTEGKTKEEIYLEATLWPG